MNFSSHSNTKALVGSFNYGWVVAGACLLIAMMGSGTRYSFGVFFKSLIIVHNIIICNNQNMRFILINLFFTFAANIKN